MYLPNSKARPPAVGRFEGVSVRERGKQLQSGMREADEQRGFSMIELSVVVMLILIISAMALIAYLPTLQDAQFDAAMKEVVDQLRQAREYAITNRRYVQVTFPVRWSRDNPISGCDDATERFDSRRRSSEPGAEHDADRFPAPILRCSRESDTPDGFGKAGPIVIRGHHGGPVGGMLFQSDGELVDGATFQPINGTVFIGPPGKNTSARAVTVLGGTGRVRGWKGTGTVWFRF